MVYLIRFRTIFLMLTLVLLCQVSLQAADAQPFVVAQVSEPAPSHTLDRLWIGSMLLVVGATAADAATSWGGREGNGILASPNGSFGTRGIAIKATAATALLLPQILFRHHTRLRPAFLAGNLAETALFSATSVHNLNVRH